MTYGSRHPICEALHHQVSPSSQPAAVLRLFSASEVLTDAPMPMPILPSDLIVREVSEGNATWTCFIQTTDTVCMGVESELSDS